MKEYKNWYGETCYRVSIDDMKGRVFSSVTKQGDDILVFCCDDGEFTFKHDQDCCESVYIESIVGDLDDLVGEPLLIAEEVESNENPPDAKPTETEYQDSFTWTFYKFATRKGYVDVRWYGESNGYYSESVDIKFSKR